MPNIKMVVVFFSCSPVKVHLRTAVLKNRVVSVTCICLVRMQCLPRTGLFLYAYAKYAHAIDTRMLSIRLPFVGAC